MRCLRFVLVAAVIGGAAFVPRGDSAFAAFHCMRIHAVMHSWDGDASIQYVELRLNAAGQTFVGGHKLEFYDSDDAVASPTATFTFPAGSVVNGAAGDSILIGTANFNLRTMAGGGPADYTFTNPGNTTGVDLVNTFPVQGANGKVHFARGFDNCTIGNAGAEVDSVEYGSFVGGAGHVGFGANAVGLPASAPGEKRALALTQVIDITPPPFTDATTNMADYALSPVSTITEPVALAELGNDLRTPRKNNRTVLKLQLPVVPVGGVAKAPDPARLPAGDEGSSSRDYAPYAAAGGAALLLMVVAAAAWQVRRRRA